MVAEKMSVFRRSALQLAGDVWKGSGSVSAFKSRTLWTCQQCRVRSRQSSRRGDDIGPSSTWTRHFSNSKLLRDSNPNDRKETTSSAPSATSSSRPSPQATTPAESSTSLPSHADNQRSHLQKRLSKIVDELLVKASIAGQHINQYTGTDYSGIEALRKEIVAQEQTVKDFLKAYDEAKAHHHEAHAKQTGAQREIVALLERKSSWTPSDLERYMSLVRSEHLNEQDVQSAKDNLAATERNLEDARGLLERLERKQYHEEQIWSDTIRRNSTWVTFGLMGVNFLLLLAQIAIFEPYRRKKIAADVKDLLDEKASRSSVETEPEADASMLPAAEVKSVPVQLVDDADAKPTDDVPPLAAIVEEADSTPIAVADALPAKVQVVEEILETDEGRPETIPESVEHTGGTAKTTLEWYQEALLDLFSERVVQMRKVDVTNTALQGAAAGVAVMGMLFVLFRPT